MRVVESIVEMHHVRATLPSPVAMMATLGGMHEGHEALLNRARREGRSVVASLFLNPTQFDDPTDLKDYPRDVARDLDIFERHGVDVVFKPSVDEIYPPGHGTTVDPGPVGAILEGARRPGHFTGVATVVAKLLVAIRPDIAIWGAKDAQQNVVIRQVARGLCMNVHHVIEPTVRADDGLALSSRNARLSVDERKAAARLFEALSEARKLWRAGERQADVIRQRIRDILAGEPLVKLEYVSVAEPRALTELEEIEPGAVLSLAAFVGSTRLIDNVTLDETVTLSTHA